MNEQKLAYQYYDSMMYNYRKWKKGGVGAKACFGRYLNAAECLAQLQAANPFKPEETQDNANKVPAKAGDIVTAVAE